MIEKIAKTCYKMEIALFSITVADSEGGRVAIPLSALLDTPIENIHTATSRVPFHWTKRGEYPSKVPFYLLKCGEVPSRVPFLHRKKVMKRPLGCPTGEKNSYVSDDFWHTGAPPHTTSALFTIFTLLLFSPLTLKHPESTNVQ